MSNLKEYIKKYPATSSLLAIMILYYIFLTLKGGSTDTLTLLTYGAFYPPIILEYNEYYRFITSIFMHIGITHIFFNAYALYNIGPSIERLMGTKKYIAFFLLTGVFGNLATFFFSFDSLSAGASGSIFGLLGAFLYLTRKYKENLPANVKHDILSTVVINLLITILVPNISITAHLGGVISGFLLSFLFLK